MLSGPPSVVAASPACSNPAFLPEARSAIQAYDQGDAFSGAVLVAVDGHPVLRQGVGMADRELGVPNAPETKFRIGSITKQFTATAILQLQEAGKLSIDDPISKYYPDAPVAWSTITLRHLLTHMSGVPTYTAISGFFDREARLPHTIDELIKLTRDKPLMFKPGSKFFYDNSGYILLGYVVEKVSGQRYEDYLKKHIFSPLGMSGSGYDDPERIILGRASGYERDLDGGWRNAPFLDMSVPFAAGSLYSTVDDLLTWDHALYTARLLKPESLQTMFTDYGHSYGFGFVIDQKWGQDRIWHNGGINGFSASFQRYPKSRVTAIAFANEVTPSVDKLAADLAGLCMGAEVYPREAPEGGAALARYTGEYKLSPSQVAKLEIRGDALVVSIGAQPKMMLYPQGQGKFFAKTNPMKIEFQIGTDGQVSGALVRRGEQGEPLTAKKIDAAEAERMSRDMAERAAAGVPTPGTEDALRRILGELQRGAPNYDLMNPDLAKVVRSTLDEVKAQLVPLGAVKSIKFKGVGPGGADIFMVTFDKGAIEWRIALGESGRVEGLSLRPAS
ncbi:serine hydrolase [Caulobacter sp. S45]|uniref:serine hydrolase n=1 Tax=Caulobacter sp. S45 TaxID=1641861 RepID=UPI0021101412|nr:serine hydrolase [Caulobacter sp. S45]